MPSSAATRPSVALVTLGCARNEVDSEELAGRLADDGWRLVDDAATADIALVNTCGFVAAAKKDSIDTILATADARVAGRPGAVVAVGCLAQRYGEELASELPEADAVLSFDDYPEIAARLRAVLAGDAPAPHRPRDRRRLLPLTPAARPVARASVPGHGDPTGDLPAGVAPASGPRPIRRRLDEGPVAPLKLASGCDRRCSFCAIPAFRGAYLSRTPDELVTEAGWLAERGAREIVLVSENSTSYGKDLGNLRMLEEVLPRLTSVDGIERVRVSYLQPAEMRPSLVEVMSRTPGVAAYFDLSFQHASATVLRRMRRFGDCDRFLDLVGQIRAGAPTAGIRSNVIVGFPGETEADLDELERFLVEARLDAIGVFGYSDEDGTEAAGFDGKLDEAEIRARVEGVARLADELVAQRADDRVGETVTVLVESPADATGRQQGRADHQAPEVDGATTLLGAGARVGDMVAAIVVAASGADLVAEAVG